MHPLFWPLQAIELNGQVYFDTRVQIGMRSAPEVAQRFTSAIVCDAERHGVRNCMAVMDDFTVVNEVFDCHDTDWKWLCARMKSLGFRLSQGVGMAQPPAQIALVLGLLYDTVAWTVGLNEERLAKLCRLVTEMFSLKKVDKKTLEKLYGFLLWVAKVVFAGRSFCHYL